MAGDRRQRLEEWLGRTVELASEAQSALTAAIDDLQSEIWLEVADLEELFVEMDTVERALQELRQGLEQLLEGDT